MPCNCDYMNPGTREKELSTLACVLYELRGAEVKKSWWEGYHPSVYSTFVPKHVADQWAADACEILKSKTKAQVSKLSLETQMWWRDHQAWDKSRKEKQLDPKKDSLPIV